MRQVLHQVANFQFYSY